MRVLSIAGSAVLVALVDPIAAQVAWSRLDAPTASHQRDMVYDAGRQRVVMFRRRGALPETWEWDGSQWRRRTTQNAPVFEGPMVYDSRRGRVVMMVGGPELETWSYDGNDWTRLDVITGEPRISDVADAAYDAVRDRIVLWDNWRANEIREWNGSLWQRWQPSVSPPAPFTRSCRLTFDPTRNVCVLVGDTPGGLSPGETWEWDGVRWVDRRTGVGGYVGTAAFGAAFNPVRGRVTVVGGSDCCSSSHSRSMYEFDGATGTWSRLSVQLPDGRAAFGLAFDPERGEMVLHGGESKYDDGQSVTLLHAETWTWSGTLVLPWSQRAASYPFQRQGEVLVTDPTRHRVLMVGGHAGSAFPVGDTWAFDGATWRLLSAPASTGGGSAGQGVFREAAAACYDAARDQTVAVGGAPAAYTGAAETWTHDGTTWQQRAGSPAPQARSDAGLAFHAPSAHSVLFGGQGGFNVFGDTWTWDGVTWTEHYLAVAPVPRSGALLAHEAWSGRTILFGGFAGTTVLGDTWAWNGNTWTRLFPPNTPTAVGLDLVADPDRRRLVMLLGTTAWEWDGADWQQRQPTTTPLSPVLRRSAWDPVLRQVLWLDTNDATWHYGPTSPARFATIGTGCAGTAGAPSRLTALQLPWLGDRYILEIDRVPASQPALALFGLSSTSWRGVPLPLALDGLGLLGCTLHSSIELAVPVLANAAGRATWEVQLGMSPALLGATFYDQAIVPAPGVNPAGLVVSDAAQVIVGAK
ncbi:MAG: hypothetical protein AAF628_30775 [Planctomycetota bacterium]